MAKVKQTAASTEILDTPSGDVTVTAFAADLLGIAAGPTKAPAAIFRKNMQRHMRGVVAAMATLIAEFLQEIQSRTAAIALCTVTEDRFELPPGVVAWLLYRIETDRWVAAGCQGPSPRIQGDHHHCKVQTIDGEVVNFRFAPEEPAPDPDPSDGESMLEGVSDDDQTWRRRSGKNSGAPPPRPQKRRRRLRQEAPKSRKLNSDHATPNLISIAKNRQANFFATDFCALSGASTLPFEDPADLQFAQQICRLWQLGQRPLVEFFDALAARHLIRTSLEKMLDQYLAGGDQ